MAIKGLGVIKKKVEEAQKNSNANRINYLRLKDGDIAIIRYLTEFEEGDTSDYHSVQEVTAKGRTYFTKKHCSEDRSCKYCSQGNKEFSQLGSLWCYCYYILHKTQNPDLGVKDEAEKWDKVNYNDVYMYKQVIESPLVFQTTPGKGASYIKQLEKFVMEYGTLLDRDYKYFREGDSKDNTAYSWMPKDKSEMSDEIKKIKENLPDLYKVISGQITHFEENDSKNLVEVEEENNDREEELERLF